MIKIKLDEKTKTNPLKEIGIQRAEGNLYNKIWFVRVHMEKRKPENVLGNEKQDCQQFLKMFLFKQVD